MCQQKISWHGVYSIFYALNYPNILWIEKEKSYGKSKRFIDGLKKLSEVDNLAGQEVIASLAGLTEDVGKYIVEFAFGEIYQRKG